jgi:hypothetical protein
VINLKSSLLLILFLIPFSLYSQNIPFGDFGNYTLELENITLSDLEFEGPIVRDGGIYEVTLTEAVDLSITGLGTLDVLVDINGYGELLLNGDPVFSGDPKRSIPFTLKAAYANQTKNQLSDARSIVVSTTTNSNTATELFPIAARKNLPPGPPPLPPTNGFNQQPFNETAYLYLYGELDVGNIYPGNYSGQITVTVDYN